MSTLTNVQAGLTFGRLRRGEAICALNELSRIFVKGKLEYSVVEEKGTTTAMGKEKSSQLPYVIFTVGSYMHC